MVTSTLVETLSRRAISRLEKNLKRPLLYDYARAEKFFLTLTWRVSRTDAELAFETIAKHFCLYFVGNVGGVYLPDLRTFVEEQCKGIVCSKRYNNGEGQRADVWFQDLHDATLFKLLFQG